MIVDTSLSGQKEAIWSYLLSNHVLSITAYSRNDAWSANLFYAGDPQQDCVYVMSSISTKHGALMKQQPVVSGTISGQEEDMTKLKGIQFLGIATVLPESDCDTALAIYQQRFPIAKHMQETLWKITFTVLKYTDNSLGFGTKLFWQQQP